MGRQHVVRRNRGGDGSQSELARLGLQSRESADLSPDQPEFAPTAAHDAHAHRGFRVLLYPFTPDPASVLLRTRGAPVTGSGRRRFRRAGA